MLGALLLTSTTVGSSIITTHPSKVKGRSPSFQVGWLASQYHVDHLISGPSRWHLNKHWIPTLCWRGASAEVEAAEARSKTSESRSYQHPPDGAPSLHHCLRKEGFSWRSSKLAQVSIISHWLQRLVSEHPAQVICLLTSICPTSRCHHSKHPGCARGRYSPRKCKKSRYRTRKHLLNFNPKEWNEIKHSECIHIDSK